MRRSRSIAVIAALAASAAFASKPVLRVNDDVITDLDLKLAERALAAQMQGAQAPEAVVLRQTVDQLISRTLILQAARDAKVTIDPKEVAASIEQQRQQVGGAEAFAKAIAQAGLTEQDLARMELDRMIIQKYVQSELASKTGASEQEVRAYYDGHPDEFKHPEQVRLRMILVQVRQGADQAQQDAAKERAEQARKRVQAGEDFAKVAAEVSEDPTKNRGGEVGWIRHGLLLQELEAPVWALKSGEVSQVLQSKFGYHVFKVDERRPAGIMGYDEVKGSLTTYLKNRKLDDSIRLLITGRRSKAKIEALDPAVKAALEPPAAPATAGEMPAADAKPAPAAQSSPAAKPTADAPKKP